MCGDKILFNKLLQKEWRSGISRRCQKFLSQIFNLHLRSIVPKCMKWMHGGTRSNAIPSLIVDSQPKIHKQGRNIYWNETKNLIPVTNDDNHDYITVETPQGFDTKVVDYHILNIVWTANEVLYSWCLVSFLSKYSPPLQNIGISSWFDPFQFAFVSCCSAAAYPEDFQPYYDHFLSTNFWSIFINRFWPIWVKMV